MAAFAKAEYEARMQRVRSAMDDAGIDALLCTDPANMNYLSGYDGWSFYVHQLVAVLADRPRPVWIGRLMDAPGAALTTWLEPSDIESYEEDYVDNPDRHPMEVVAETLRRAGQHRARIGLETDSWYFTARAAEVLRTALPDAVFVDAFGLVNRVRLVKSPAEIAMMRIAGRIAGLAMEVGFASIIPGKRECDVAAEITAAQFRGTEKDFGDYPAALVQAPAGRRSAAPHLTWTNATYDTNTVVCIELAGCHHRYHAPLARTVCLGPVTAPLAHLAPVVEDGMQAALEAARPGNTCEGVEAAWRKTIARAGYQKQSRIGYSVGLGYPPDWGERSASLRPKDRTVLVENMCFHVILGMWDNQGGYSVSETIRIDDAGPPELLTDCPRQLLVKD